MKRPSTTISARCRCGAFSLCATGAPILSTACYCKSCQAAAPMLGSAEPLLEADGGTLCVLHRKDRVSWTCGPEALREHRLTPSSTTRRVVARCCDTPMFMEFTDGHWLSLYTRRITPDARPPLQSRVMTRDAPPGARFDDGIPSYRTHSARFYGQLLWAWACMGFRAPAIDLTRSTREAG